MTVSRACSSALPLGHELCGQSLGACALRAHSLPDRLQLDALLELGGASRLDLGQHRIAGGDIQHRAGSRLVLLVVGDSALDGGLGFAHLLGGEVEALREALPLGLRGLELDAEASELLGLGGQRRVVLAQGGEGGGGIRLGCLERSALLGEGEAGALDLGGDCGELRRGGIAFGDQLEAGALGARAARSSALSLAVDQKDGSSALVGAKLGGIRGLVAEHVKIEPGFEAAIAAALGSLADAVLADSQGAAFDALTHSAAQDFGRVEVAVADSAAPKQAAAPAGVRAATEVVTAPDGVLGLLAGVYIADDLDAARSAFAKIGDATFVTKQGDVLTRYVLRGGSGAKRSRLELVAERDAAAAKLATSASAAS